MNDPLIPTFLLLIAFGLGGAFGFSLAKAMWAMRARNDIVREEPLGFDPDDYPLF